ncbi:peptidoglycan DD-metalloendopeptidase family protein [Halalkalibacter kiskunsagensis]|uniref:Peptidoglycan DD-metalloendopeptidase family protein n=1 Tax=Halalkalibacter kiskunsagensis TaxID=1548599 RepID=A0ABV6KE33_9BACI
MVLTKGNLQSYSRLPAKRMIQTCFTLLFFVISLVAVSTVAKADGKSNVYTIYHIYVGDKHIGTLQDDEPVLSYIEETLKEYEKEYPDLSLQIDENIKVIPEMVFNEEKEDEDVLSSLEDKMIVQAEAIALVIDDQPAVYVATIEEAEKAIEKLVTQYVDKEAYEHFQMMVEEDEDLTLKVGEEKITNLSLTEEVIEEESVVLPEEVLSVEDAVLKINKGVLKEQPYIVKEGDVLSSIANNHDLTTAKLLELNKELDVDSVIRVGQEIQVTVYEPLVKVLTTKVEKVEEEIPYQTEVKEDDSMWKGDQKVTQQGQTGIQLLEYEITEQDGNVIQRKVLLEEVTKEPVKKIIVKGTKEMPSRGSGSLGWPAVGGYISSYQGNRWGRFHRGIDIARPNNYNILAADNGTISFAGSQGGYGNLVRINHNNGMETLYAHLDSIDVKVGQTVAKGQKIGVMGQTGHSTGIHLHFEVYENGQLKNPMDYLK